MIATKIPSLKGWAQCLWAILRVLNIKTPQRQSCPCGGFPAISHRQTVDWTWLWKIRALHMWWVPLPAPWGQELQHEFQVIPGVGFCYVLGMQLFVVVATAVARYNSKGQCYSTREYRRRWTVHWMWGKRPWGGWVWGDSKLACSSSLTPCFVNNDCVTIEIIFSAAHVRQEVLTWSWATLCCRNIWASLRKWWHFTAVSRLSVGSATRGENIVCILLWLLYQPGENKSVYSSVAPWVFFLPLSSCLTYPGFNEQCVQWDTVRQLASPAESAIHQPFQNCWEKKVYLVRVYTVSKTNFIWPCQITLLKT